MLYRQFFVVTLAVAAFGVLLNQVIETTHKQSADFQISFESSKMADPGHGSINL